MPRTDGRVLPKGHSGNRYKGGRPKRNPVEMVHIKERKELLDLGQYLGDIANDLERLRKMGSDDLVTNAQVAAVKASLGGSLALVNKLVPDLKAIEKHITADIRHHTKPVDPLELIARIQLATKQHNQDVVKTIEQATSPVEDGVPVLVPGTNGELVDDMDGVVDPPTYEWL